MADMAKADEHKGLVKRTLYFAKKIVDRAKSFFIERPGLDEQQLKDFEQGIMDIAAKIKDKDGKNLFSVKGTQILTAEGMPLLPDDVPPMPLTSPFAEAKEKQLNFDIEAAERLGHFLIKML